MQEIKSKIFVFVFSTLFVITMLFLASSSSPRRFLHNPLHLSALVKMTYLLLLFM